MSLRHLVVACVFGAACGGSKSPPPPPPQNTVAPAPAPARAAPAPKEDLGVAAAMKKMADLTDEMCRCVDAACADKVQRELTTWAERMANQGGDENIKATQDQMDQMTVIGRRYGECMTKVMTPPAQP